MLPFDKEQQLNKSPLDEETLLSGQFWGELRVFLAVAKTKSFNRAAEITNTSQPTVSRQVKRLQDVVGSQLFISTPRGVKLTQKGEALAQALTRLDYTLHSLTCDLKAESRSSVTTGRSRFVLMDANVAAAPGGEPFRRAAGPPKVGNPGEAAVNVAG